MRPVRSLRGEGLLQLVKRKNFLSWCCMLPGSCCIAIATLEPVMNGDSWYHMCAFRFHFWGRKVNWNQASHVRASSVPNLYAFCLNKRSCIFVRTGRPLLLILRFCGLIFGTARPSQKWDRENAFSFVLLLSCACGPKNGTARRSHFWDRV